MNLFLQINIHLNEMMAHVMLVARVNHRNNFTRQFLLRLILCNDYEGGQV